MNALIVSDADHATILAALRYYQQNGQGNPDNRDDNIHDIATNGDSVISLDEDAIDDLCERINRDESPTLVVVMDGGLIQFMCSEEELPLNVIKVDLDTEGAQPDEYLTIENGSETIEAFVSGFPIDVDPDTVNLYRDALKEAVEKETSGK